MSEANVDIVQRGFVATIQEDWPTALATLHPQVEILDYDIPDARTHRGHEGFFVWLQNWGAGWEEWRTEDMEFRPTPDDGVIALFTVVARGKGSGIEVARSDAIVYRLKDGLIERQEYFNDQSKALETIGAHASGNVELMRRGIDAFNRRDVDAFRALMTEYAELIPIRAAVEGTSYRGPSSAAEFFAATDETWETVRFEATEIMDTGVGVLAPGRLRARGRGSGVDVEMDIVVTLRVRDGLIERFRAHADSEAARSEAGLVD